MARRFLALGIRLVEGHTENMIPESDSEPSNDLLVKPLSAHRLALVSVALATSVVVASVALMISHGQSHARWRTQALSGEVLLTENQLVDVVKSEKLVTYWSGPLVGYRYTLDTTAKNRIILSYFPTASSNSSASRLVATYFSERAYLDSKSASKLSGNSGFTNANGAFVFYSTKKTTDIYLAFKKKPYQIEIFDPAVGQAISLAILKNQISPIGA